MEPQLATLATTLPIGSKWLIENKYDGYRLLTRIDRGRVTLFTRGGQDWTTKFAEIAAESSSLSVDTAWLDGEIVVLVNDKPDFGALQEAISQRRSARIVYFVFDLLYLDGLDLRKIPLWTRRMRLRDVIGDGDDHVRFSEDFDAPAVQLLKAACEIGLEGILIKDRNAPYESGRTQSWLKGKCRLRQEFVVCGFTTPPASHELSGLILGYYSGTALRHAGHVGTGWDVKMADDLHKRLAKIEVPASPFDGPMVKERRWGEDRERSTG
ncbi:non-homologous end-joining DNA ligase [Paraburkholderia edwinii]|uniref:non-homologous end-joining DNA ligase n=1 Tax=Paraburkholderia edwinii TaxID=2861782 RepID=UPI0031BA12C5